MGGIEVSVDGFINDFRVFQKSDNDKLDDFNLHANYSKYSFLDLRSLQLHHF